MKVRTGVFTLSVAVAAIFVLSGILDVVVSDVDAVEEVTSEGPYFRSKTVFCPPSIQSAEQQLWALVRGDEPARVALEPGEGEVRRIQGGRAVKFLSTGGGSDVVGYGGSVAATATATFSGEGGGGIASAACADAASPTWYFGEGSTDLGFDQKLLLYNPFPEEAVVSVTIYGRRGASSPATLGSIAVAANDSTVVSFNQALEVEQPLLSARVTANRGRVVAWRVMRVTSEDAPDGVQMTLGSPETATSWFFADGRFGEGFDERLILVNPTEEEAVANVSLLSGQGTGGKGGLRPVPTDITLPPMTSRSVKLSQLLRGQKPPPRFGTVVRSTNGVPIVVERTIYYSGNLTGTASDLGAARTSNAWTIGPPSGGGADEFLVVANGSENPVTVDVSLSSVGRAPIAPEPLQGLRIGGWKSLQIPLDEWANQGRVVASVVATGPVISERWAYSSSAGDVTSLMGTPATAD